VISGGRQAINQQTSGRYEHYKEKLFQKLRYEWGGKMMGKKVGVEYLSKKKNEMGRFTEEVI